MYCIFIRKGLDPSGAGFKGKNLTHGIDQGIAPDAAEYVEVIYTNPYGHGTDLFDLGQVNILINPNSKPPFCQPGCGSCNSDDNGCLHEFAYDWFVKCVQNTTCCKINGDPFTLYTVLPSGQYTYETTKANPICNA